MLETANKQKCLKLLFKWGQQRKPPDTSSYKEWWRQLCNKWKTLGKKFKPCSLSHLHTPGQSVLEMDTLVELLISKGYRNCQKQQPQFHNVVRGCLEGGCTHYQMIHQALCFKHSEVHRGLCAWQPVTLSQVATCSFDRSSTTVASDTGFDGVRR